uniref:Uncharacterized protein n=1 Tax=Arundo donax TaxID=35708 RepID=A0A0A9CJF9_ARUDO
MTLRPVLQGEMWKSFVFMKLFFLPSTSQSSLVSYLHCCLNLD